MTTGKRVCLKDQCIITTEELYAKLQRCEQTTAEKKASKGHRRVDSALATLRDIAANEEESEQAWNDVIWPDRSMYVAGL